MQRQTHLDFLFGGGVFRNFGIIGQKEQMAKNGKDAWKAREHLLLVEGVRRHGHNWSNVCKALKPHLSIKGRSPHSRTCAAEFDKLMASEPALDFECADESQRLRDLSARLHSKHISSLKARLDKYERLITECNKQLTEMLEGAKLEMEHASEDTKKRSNLAGGSDDLAEPDAKRMKPSSNAVSGALEEEGILHFRRSKILFFFFFQFDLSS